MLLWKDKLNTIEIPTSKALINPYISYDELFLVNNVLKEYNEMKKKKKKSWNFYGIHYINKVDISRKSYERNVIGTIVNNDGIPWLNEKHIK